MTEELRIKETKSIANHGFVDFLQEIISLTKDGWILDLRNKYAPQFMIGIFCANFYKLEEEVVAEKATDVANNTTEEKPKRTYTKADKAKEALKAKLPAEATKTVTQ